MNRDHTLSKTLMLHVTHPRPNKISPKKRTLIEPGVFPKHSQAWPKPIKNKKIYENLERKKAQKL